MHYNITGIDKHFFNIFEGKGQGRGNEKLGQGANFVEEH